MAYDSDLTPKSADLIVLEKARERIARGWKGAACAGNSFCAWLAIVTGNRWQEADLRRWAEALGFRGCGEVIAWNDAPGRTQAEVLARFDEAISRLASAQ